MADKLKSNSMQVSAAIGSLRWKPGKGSWKTSESFETLLQTLERAGLRMQFTHFGKLIGKPRRLGAKVQLLNALMTSDTKLTVVDNADRWLAFVHQSDFELTLTAGIVGENWGECANWLPVAVEALHRQLADRIWLGPRIYAKPEINVPRLLPPRRHQFLELQSGCDVVNHAALCERADERKSLEDQFRTLATETLPEGVRRELVGNDLLILRWAADGAPEREVREALVTKQKWLLKHVPLEIDPSYNEFGDALTLPFGLSEHPNATFYNARTAEAYQTVVPLKGGIDPKLLREIQTWLEKGSLPDDKPLKRFHIILPSREVAMALQDKARAAGVSKLLYVRDKGSWWDPFPEGEWIK